MIKDMLSALGVVLAVGLVAYGIGWGLLAWQTADSRILEPAAASATAAPSTQSDALDAVLGAASQAISGVAQNRQEAQRQRAADGLIRNYMALSSITTLLAALWTIFAWTRTRDVGHAQSQRLASGVWLIGLLVAASAAAGLFWMSFAGRGPAAAVTATMTGGMVLVGLVLVWLNYHLATAFSAPSVLRSSVPMANSIVPLNWTR